VACSGGGELGEAPGIQGREHAVCDITKIKML